MSPNGGKKTATLPLDQELMTLARDGRAAPPDAKIRR